MLIFFCFFYFHINTQRAVTSSRYNEDYITLHFIAPLKDKITILKIGDQTTFILFQYIMQDNEAVPKT